MKYIDFTLPTPAANLACDEALLDWAEANAGGELLRFWEAREPFVVVGYANEVAREVNVDACVTDGVAIRRRCTGGGTVLQGPGCLNYTLILRISENGPLRSVSAANHFVMERNRAALQSLIKGTVDIQGCTDLTLDNLKFSGNAQRRRRQYLIFHGTFLLDFDISLVEKYLLMPSKQPDYRHLRSHAEFLTNLNVSPDDVKSALRKVWDANAPLPVSSLPDFSELIKKYSDDAWNSKF